MKSYRILFFMGCLLMASACSLEEKPYGFLSTTNFYKTESDAVSSLAFCYDIMAQNEYFGRYLYFVGTIPTEEMTLKSDAGADDKQLDNGNVTPNNLDLNALFSNAYIAINRVNTTLKFVPGIKTIGDSTMSEILGEAHFLRALHYFNLVRVFGEVPIRTEPVLNDGNLNIAVSSMSAIYDLIEQDLLQAETMTDLTFRDGRANRVAVQALLAKVYLQLASAKASGVDKYDFVSGDYYAKSLAYADKVMNNSVYHFWTGDIKALWDVDNQSGNEFIFSIAYHAQGALSEGDFSKLAWLLTPYISSPMSLGPDFTATIPANAYGHMKTEIPFYESFRSIDKRKTDLIVSDVLVGNPPIHYTLSNGQLPYPFTRKYEDKNQVGDQSSHYIPVLRFSDIALVYAEAAGATSQAYSWINKIRSRAGLPDLTSGLSDAAFRDSVFVERGFELAFEGQRLFDLRRTKKMEEVLVNKYGKTLGETAYYYSIPQQEKDLNSLID